MFVFSIHILRIPTVALFWGLKSEFVPNNHILWLKRFKYKAFGSSFKQLDQMENLSYKYIEHFTLIALDSPQNRMGHAY